MGFSVSLYFCSDDNRVVSKNLQHIITVNGLEPSEPLSVIEPRVVVEYNGAFPMSVNYMSCWGRYYFVTNIELIRGQRAILTGKVDVLKTYESDIRNSQGLCIRNENTGIGGQKDPKLPLEPTRMIKVARFSKSLNRGGAYPFVLNVAGGGGSQ